MNILSRNKTLSTTLAYLVALALCVLLTACDANISLPGNGNIGDTNGGQCLSNCTLGSGVHGVQVFVEPDSGEHVITDAIRSAKKSVWLEIYLLTDRNVISALEEDANRGIDVRVMLEPHPFGGGSPTRTIDQLKAAGVKAQDTSPSFPLTHKKGMIIDSRTVFIMTSNFTRSALGGSSGSSGFRNREYDIVDTNSRDVQAVIAIFNADWNRTTAQFNDSNLVVSPVNSRGDFTSLISSAHHTLLIEA